MGLAAYFLGALALLRWYERMPHNRIGYADLVLPARWAEISTLRGKAIIASAYDDLESGNFQSGFAKLRMGLARSPADTEARLNLARIYVALRLRPAAERTLLDAFAHGYPGGSFVNEAFALLATGDHPEQVIVFCEKARISGRGAGASAGDLLFIEEGWVRTLLESGRSAEALALVESLQNVTEGFAEAVRVRHLLETKAYDEAVRATESWLAASRDSEKALRMAVRVYREAGRFGDMQKALAKLRARLPVGPEYGVLRVVQNAIAGQWSERDAAVGDFLFRHGAYPRNLMLLVSSLGEIGDADVIKRVETDAGERGFSLARIRLVRLQALIETRAWEEACSVADDLSSKKKELSPEEVMFLQTQTLLVKVCREGGNGEKLSLVEALSRHPGTIKLYRSMIEALLSAGKARTALGIISHGEGPFPDSQYLRQARARVMAQVTKEEAQVEASIVREDNGPSQFGNLEALLEAVARQAKAGFREDALLLIRRHRRAAPMLFPENNPDLARFEVTLSAESRDLAQLHFHLRTHLRTGALKADEVLALALDWHKIGHIDSAHATVRELLKRDPEHENALRVWSAWMPKPGAGQTIQSGARAEKTAVLDEL
jgi:tetratricopeptide (TPR) repeat protein